MTTLRTVSATQLEQADPLPAPLRALLRDGDLPAGVLLTLVAEHGPAALGEACTNPFLDDQAWAALYRAAPAVGRAALTAGRLLSRAQRATLVIECRETNPTILEAVADQLDRVELDILLAQPLPALAAEVLRAEQEQRRAGVPPVRSQDDMGLVLAPEDIGTLPWEADAVIADDYSVLPAATPPDPSHGRAHEQRCTAAAVAVLTPVLGNDKAAWVAASHLVCGFAGTWLELAWTASALMAPSPAR